jgi:hypothetical protein
MFEKPIVVIVDGETSFANMKSKMTKVVWITYASLDQIKICDHG